MKGKGGGGNRALNNHEEDNKMEEKQQTTVEECLVQLGASQYHAGTPWNGYDVIVPELSGCVGLPLVILAKNGEVHISTPDEAIDYLAFSRRAKKTPKGN